MSLIKSAHLDEVLFTGYMSLRRCTVSMLRDTDRIEARSGLVFSGPGHDVAILAALSLDANRRPQLLFKAGDTRPARTLRGEPYVKTGIVGGRLDHAGVGAAATAALELTEETGGGLVEGTLRLLGAPAPTMPALSSEEDHYFAAAAHFPPASAPRGDGTGMELSGLIRPLLLGAASALTAIDDGTVGEAARARTAFGRALSAIGYLPGLDRYVYELRDELAARWDTLGAGDLIDTRAWPAGAPPPDLLLGPGPASLVDGCDFVSEQAIELEDGIRFVDALAAHVITSQGRARVGQPYRVQYLHLPWDVVKLVRYAPDPVHGACVALRSDESLPLLAKSTLFASEVLGGVAELERRPDVDELLFRLHDGEPSAVAQSRLEHEVAELAHSWGATSAPERLGASADASPGQSDMRYQFYAVPVPRRPELTPLSEAIRACRKGRGEAATECALLRLAHRLSYVPELELFNSAVLG